MEATQYKLRDDLVISEQNGPQGSIFVIKDPAVDRFFRFKEIEHFIASQFDGATPLDITRQRVEERFGVALSTENLEQFSTRLQNIGLLIDKDKDEAEAEVSTRQKNRRWAGDMFYLRFKLFNPDRLFDLMLPQVRFLFTPAFMVISAMTVLLGVGVTVANWTQVTYQFYNLLHIESLLLAWFIMIGVVTLHEFAHGLTCKHFGGHVREIGFMLIYFQPAFYCNVSDAWLFPEKSKRMWVTFAGGYFEVFLWALATLIWRLTDPATAINHLALIVTATSAFKMFFNLNPLIKLDGYYLLSDWLDVPNLRYKSSSYLGYRIKKLWGGGGEHEEKVTQREHNIYIIYAILSTLYIYWILSHIAMYFGNYMVSNYQAWGFIIFSLILGFMFRKKLSNLFAPTTSLYRSASESMGFRVPKLAKWGIGLTILLAILFFVRSELKVSGPIIVMPSHNADIRAEVEGIIGEIFVEEGDVVEKGAPIARLSGNDYKADLQRTLAEIEAKEARLKLLKKGPRREEIDLARTRVAKVEELSGIAQSQLKRDKMLVDEEYISIAKFEETKELATIREKELEEARGELNMLLAGSRQEEIEALQADTRALEAYKSYLQEILKSLTVVSPISGVVTTHKLKEKIGENIERGQLIAEVHELRTVTVEIAVPEKEIGDVNVGQKVVLKARAYPFHTFTGNVVMIAPVATKPEEQWVTDRTVRVTTRLANPDGLLKPEMTGNAKIYCGERRLYDLLTRRFIRYFRVEFWAWW